MSREVDAYVGSGAQFSPCEKYRFTLWRVWDHSLPRVAFVGLNPSTADATKDDPTIRRCVGFARSHGYGSLTMLNLWALRATDPYDLTGEETNEEDANLDAIAAVSATVTRVVGAWGAHPKAERRMGAVVPIIREWWCLDETAGGMPRHPLYLKATCQMKRWAPAALRAVGGEGGRKDG